MRHEEEYRRDFAALTCGAFVVALLAAALLAAANKSRGAEPTERERRTRVALALAEPPKSAGALEPCGLCLDLSAARAECWRTGKPLVLFVGGCFGRAKDLPAGVIPSRTDDYSGDDRGKESRIVLIYRNPKNLTALYYLKTLSASATKAEIADAVRAAKAESGDPVKAPALFPIDWKI